MDSSPRSEVCIRHCAMRFTARAMQKRVTLEPLRYDIAYSANSVRLNHRRRIQKEGKTDRGVAKGCPTLFNIFIDTLAVEVESHLGNSVTHMPQRLYADGVMLHAENMIDLQCAN